MAELDPDRCYRALAARDPRFDGVFFVGVRTTRVFCRPVCPAPTPKSRNVRFFPTASAASSAGFRPCLRCCPESAPGSTGRLGTSATVRRALRLIEDGALDRGGVDDLARTLGIGARQLRRVFLQHVGAAPNAVARIRRLLFAKKLLAETGLGLAEIALAAGYSSPRRLHEAFRATFSLAPSDVRRKAAATDGPGIELTLAFRPPLDWTGLAGFLGARAVPGVERVTQATYARTVAIAGVEGWFSVEPRDERTLALIWSVPSHESMLTAVGRVRRMFALDADPAPVEEHLGADPLLAAAVSANPGRRVPGAWDPFELAVRAVLGQQVTVRGATTLAARIVERYGRPLARPAPGLTALFPEPARIARARLETIGLPRARAATIRRVAQAFVSGDPTPDELRGLAGIGDWTAQYVAMRAFGDPDAFPASDLGLRKALGGERPVSARAALARAEAWRPWRATAATLLWNPR